VLGSAKLIVEPAPPPQGDDSSITRISHSEGSSSLHDPREARSDSTKTTETEPSGPQPSEATPTPAAPLDPDRSKASDATPIPDAADETPGGTARAKSRPASRRHGSELDASLAAETTPLLPESNPSGPRTVKVLLAMAAAAAIVTALYVVDQRRRGSELAAAAAPETTEGAAEPSASAPLAEAPRELAPEDGDGGSDSDPMASGEPAASTTSGRLPSPTQAPSSDGLAEDETWLWVRSHGDASVFVHGIDVGQTNQWLRSRCGTRFIRLGAAPGQWISEGVPHRLSCRRPVTIEIEPTRDEAPPPQSRTP
jgi:hypothetical protein